MEREAYSLMERQEASHWWFVGRRQIISELIKIRGKLPMSAKVLEAGCGTGGNLSLLSRYGDVEAFEYDEKARSIATVKSGISIKAGRLPDNVCFQDNSFDLIALLDVLEHLDDDEAALSALKSKLAQGGKILLTVPAAPWLWSEHDVMHHHKRRYTKSQLKQLLMTVGFSDIHVGYFNFFLFPLAVTDRILAKLGIRRSSGSQAPPKSVNSIFSKIFSSEASYLKFFSFPFGLSLYAVASRRS